MMARFISHPGMRNERRGTVLARLFILAAIVLLASLVAVGAPAEDLRHSITELTPVVKIHLAKTADWVAIVGKSIWVGTTGPNGVSQIDSETNSVVGRVPLPGIPCAGLAVGFGALWVPLCARPNSLARVDLNTRAISMVPHLGPAAREGGIATSPDSVWLVTDGRGTLARIDPDTLRIRQRIRVPRGSHNPLYSEGRIWITRSAGAEVSVIRADTGLLLASVPSGPKPRFLAGGGGSVWTTMVKVPLSAIDGSTGRVRCQFTGPGGDSLGVNGDSLWLTDYTAGDIYRYDLDEVMRRCD